MRLINTHAPIAAKKTAHDLSSHPTRSINRVMSAITFFVLLIAICLSAFVLIAHNRPAIDIMQGIDHQQQRLLEQRP